MNYTLPGDEAVSPWQAVWRFCAPLVAVFDSYSELLFLRGTAVGLIMAAATFLQPNVGMGGLIAVFSAYLFGRLMGFDREFFKTGYYTYNPLLVGLALGSYLALGTPWAISWVTVFFVASMGVLSLVLTVVLGSLFQTYFRLPVLSLPFVISMTLGYIASQRYSNLFIDHATFWFQIDALNALPPLVTGYLRALGAILFAPSAAVGLVLAGVLLWRSRILFGLSIAGFLVGTTIRGWLMASTHQTLGDDTGFNFVLIAMAIGGVFFVPSIRSYSVALAAVAVSTILLDSVQQFWSQYGIPVYTLPFNVISLGFIYALGLAGYSRVPLVMGRTPEETLEYDLAFRWRAPVSWRSLRMPFFGTWTVWQAFDDQWTHQGAWKYAYDFVITGDDQRTFCGQGTQLTDYHCYRKPVVSPVRGRVVKVVNEVVDNEPGMLNATQNWGNFVLIYDQRGFYVQLAHLSCNSIRVAEGAWVEPGMVLGLCGNSGYSPQPHLHVQAQLTDTIGAPTVPFSFSGFIADGQFIANGLPARIANVDLAVVDPALNSATEFLLSERYEYDVLKNGQSIDRLRLQVKIAFDGTMYFESGSGGKLYFGKRDGMYFHYRCEGHDRYLSLMQTALPCLPLTHREGMVWRDLFPATALQSRGWRAAHQIISAFVPELSKSRFELKFLSPRDVSCHIRSRLGPLRQDGQATTRFDEHKGFLEIAIGPYALRRIDAHAA